MMNAQRFSGPESPLRGVSREAWLSFYTNLEVQASSAISESGGLGAFDIRPRRLVELGYATGLRGDRGKHDWIGVKNDKHTELVSRCRRCKLFNTEGTSETCEKGRSIQVCEFILPWTQKRFLGDPYAQYTALVQSMRLYFDALREGKLLRPVEASMAGTLVVLHRGGRGALEAWPKLFAGTKALYDKVHKLF